MKAINSTVPRIDLDYLSRKGMPLRSQEKRRGRKVERVRLEHDLHQQIGDYITQMHIDQQERLAVKREAVFTSLMEKIMRSPETPESVCEKRLDIQSTVTMRSRTRNGFIDKQISVRASCALES